jgi:hypothetical protein
MDWMFGIRFPAEARDYSPLYSVQTVSGVHSASYAISTGGDFCRGKTAEV